MPQPRISMSIDWRWTEGGAGPCLSCGEPVYLRGAQAFIVVGGESYPLSDKQFCQSCAEIQGLTDSDNEIA